MILDTDINQLNNQKVLVTGATGFIGSHLVERLVSVHSQVIAVGPGVGWRQNVKRLIERGEVRFVKLASFWDPKSIERIKSSFQGVEYVIHLAYVMPNGNNLIEIASKDLRKNVLGTLTFIKSLPQSVKKIIFASSCMVYGLNSTTPVSETSIVKPGSVYASGKFVTENYLRLFASERQISMTVLRYATVYGPFETDPRAIPNFIRCVLAEKPPVIYGDGNDVRDYVNVKDVIEATAMALVNDKTNFEIFNIGSGRGYSTKEVADHIIKLSGKCVELSIQKRYSDAQKIICDISKAKDKLGYVPSIEFLKGLTEEINFFLENPRFWRRR